MKHQIQTAIRNLRNSSFSTVLNLTGLASAFTAFILIMMYVWNENHFDFHNQHVHEIYRLETKYSDSPKTSVYLLGPTGKTLNEEFPEILASTIYMPWGKWGEETFTWKTNNSEIKGFEDYAYSDEMLTDIFTFDFRYGNKISPLQKPETAIVSSSFARKAWGDRDPTGEQIKMGGITYTISAVFSDLAENSVIRCPIILKLSDNSWLGEYSHKWDMTNYPQFILVKPGTDIHLLTEKINALSIIQSKYNRSNISTSLVKLITRPLSELRFAGDVAENPLFTGNSRLFVKALFWIGILIILVAFVNYINFFTANAPKRMKSIKINRVVGSSKAYSVFTIIIETVLLNTIAFIIALLLAYYINTNFTLQVFGYSIPFFENYKMLVFIGLGCMLLAALVSIYPAIHSTSGKLAEIKKGAIPNRGINLRGSLSVVQFAVTIVLIALSILVVKQVYYMKETDLGFNKASTMVLRMNSDLAKNYKAFENALKSSPYVSSMACSRAVPGQAQEGRAFNVEGKMCSLWYWAVDDKYIDLMNFNIIQGRKFIAGESEDQNVICNETAAKAFHWELGVKIGNGYLVGIVKDFNFISLREKVDPFAFWYSHSKQSCSCISIKLTSDNVSGTIADIKKAYDAYSPEIPFRYFFLDEHLNYLYSKENQQVKMISAFSFLSVIVSILGILGLSTFMCQFRIKEIGIRKVNGAQISRIMTMLNVDFVKWVFIAYIFATPIAWYAMNKWLQNFAYKTELSWWVFAVAGLLALMVALATVSWQSWRAATRNPVESLRYE